MAIALNIFKTFIPLAVVFGLGWYFGTRRKGDRKVQTLPEEKGSKTSRAGNEQKRKEVNENTSNVREPGVNSRSPSLSQLCPPDSESRNADTYSASQNNQNLNSNGAVKRHHGTAVKHTRSLDDQNTSQQNNRQEDIETDAPSSISMHESLSVDAEPFIPVNGCQMVDDEKHDAMILYAEGDELLARQLQRDLVTNVIIPDLNVILYDEFAPDVQSHFKTMAIVFERCRYLLVLVTNNFTEASFSRFQNEIALKDSIENSSRNDRVIPVWGVSGAQNIVHELSILKGIDYTEEVLEADSAHVYSIFKKTFLHGRSKIKMA